MSRVKYALAGRVTFFLICFTTVCVAQELPQQPQQPSSQQNQYRNQAQTTAQDQRQRHIDSFPGTISQKHGKLYLQIAHTKTSYELADAWEAKRFLNKKVRVTGWLDVENEILHVTTIAKTP